MKESKKTSLCILILVCIFSMLMGVIAEEGNIVTDMNEFIPDDIIMDEIEAFVPEVDPMELGDQASEEPPVTSETFEEVFTEESANAVIKDTSEFKDASFRDYVLMNFDTNGDDLISDIEASAVETIDVSGEGIASLEGISKFSKLKTLKCANNRLISLDLTGNTALSTLICDGNDIVQLDLAKCPTLLNYVKTICPKISGEKIYYTKKVNSKDTTVLSIPYDMVIVNDKQIVFDPIEGMRLTGTTISLKVGEKVKLIPDDCHFPAVYC